jgi:hypothetical protein
MRCDKRRHVFCVYAFLERLRVLQQLNEMVLTQHNFYALSVFPKLLDINDFLLLLLLIIIIIIVTTTTTTTTTTTLL